SKGVLWSDSIAERLTRPTAYKFKTDCSIIPVWCSIHTVIIDPHGIREIKKVYIQSFRTISENQCLLQMLNVMEIRRRYIIKAFQIPTDMSMDPTEVVASMEKKSSMETFAPSDKADYYSRITSITVNGKNTYELKGKFLDDLHNIAFSGTNGKYAVEHIEYYLKIVDPIKLPNVDHDKLRVVVFSISLAGGARRCFDRTKESTTCWVDLTAKFFRKYYPPSRIKEINTPIIKWDPTNPKFEGWLATKFVNYKMMDILTKRALWNYWKMVGDKIEVSDDESSDLEEY
ncbi:hypothetical protein Tco_0684873, partial [Tanacetum coccineum]